MNITYTQNGDYLIPNIIIRKTKPLGHYGRLRKAYLEMHRPILFNELVLSDKLFEHCAEIDEAARNRMELIVRSLAEQNGVSEQLKAENQMEWVHFQIRLAKSAVVSEGLGLADNDVRDKIIAFLCISDIHAVCTPFIGSLCGKLLTGTNTPFAMSSARMAAFLASISAFFRFLILSSYRFCAPLAFRFK